jgi:hypothetical protein
MHGLEIGAFATLDEAAKVAGVSRQRVGEWLKAAGGIGWKARQRALADHSLEVEKQTQRQKRNQRLAQRVSAARAPQLKWRIYQRRRNRTDFLGLVFAPDDESALQKAFKTFGIVDSITRGKIIARRDSD